MILEKIKQETCGTCGACTVSDERRAHRHSSGEPFESRRFACGSMVAWSPNFSRLQVDRTCPKDPDQVELRSKINKLANMVLPIVRAATDIDVKLRLEIERDVENAFRAGREPGVWGYF